MDIIFNETSALTGEKVKEAFDDIFEQLYNRFEEEIKGIKCENSKSTSITKGKMGKNKKKCC